MRGVLSGTALGMMGGCSYLPDWAQVEMPKMNLFSSGNDTGPDTLLSAASAQPELSTFVTGIEAAGLAEELSTGGPFTVFAPSNTAFSALPDDMLATLFSPENRDALAQRLRYHMIPGRVLSEGLSGASLNVATLAGPTVSIDGRGTSVLVNEAMVTEPDRISGNGVIHVIDAVLLDPV